MPPSGWPIGKSWGGAASWLITGVEKPTLEEEQPREIRPVTIHFSTPSVSISALTLFSDRLYILSQQALLRQYNKFNLNISFRS